MTTIERLRSPRIQQALTAASIIAVLLVLPQWGGRAMMVGAALSLVVYTVVFDCSKVVRLIMGCIAVLACMAAGYFIVVS